MTVREAYIDVRSRLIRSEIEGASVAASELCRHCFGMDKNQLLLTDREVTKEELAQIDALCKERIRGVPLQYLLGEWSFFGRSFFVDKGVLIPREDTEVVCRAVQEQIEGKSQLVAVDLCSGSGCIAITLAGFNEIDRVIAAEKEEAAFEMLLSNVDRHKASVEPVCTDIFDEDFLQVIPLCDVIVSNPPYVKTGDMGGLSAEVQYEPDTALDGGEDGLDFYRKILPLYHSKLKKGGLIALEFGQGQEEAVKNLLTESGYTALKLHKDFSQIIRAVTAEKE